MKQKLSLLQLNLLPFLLVMIAGGSAYPQDKTAEIDKIFSWATPDAPGCVCAVSQNGKIVVNRAYGSADLERDVLLKPESVFDAGSLTKQFVAAAALLLVEEGKLSLTEDIRKYIPELPDYGRKITLDHLLTHTSGIRDWTGMLPIAAGSPAVLDLILRQRSLDFDPGTEISYSNSGYVLAKEIVARAAGISFAEFTRQRLFEPLGMTRTAYRENMREVIRDRALAYDREGGQWRMAMLMDNNRGGGGVLTTAADLLTWNEALSAARLGKLVNEKLHEPARLSNGRKLDYSRGLFIDNSRNTPVFWHTGSADGYKSWLGRFPEYKLAIAIMCNSGDGTDRSAFAERIFRLFVPEDQQGRRPQPPAAGDNTDAADLNKHTGLYMAENGEMLRLVTEKGRLRVANGPILSAVSANEFKRVGNAMQFMSGDAFTLNFRSEDLMELRSMEGTTRVYRKSKPYSPTAEELSAFAGRYHSDELGSVLQLSPGKDGLQGRFEHIKGPVLPLKGVAPDVFQFSRVVLRFIRDKNGKVIGVEYTNPVVRKIRFNRLATEKVN